MKYIGYAVLAAACCFSAVAQTEPDQTPVVRPESRSSFMAGGVALTLPGPPGDFEEVGDRLRTTLFELLAPSTNRLLSAYLPAQALTKFNQANTAGRPDMSTYALVEVPRQAEYMDCGRSQFQQVLQSLESSMGQFAATGTAQAEEEINPRLKALGAKPVEIGHPDMLGGLFKKADASGFGMRMALKQGDRTVTLAVGLAVLRVRQRLVYAYLYVKYESPETVLKMRKDLESWADAILAKNQ